MSGSIGLKYRIGFVADWDANDPGAMSGAAYYMKRAFVAQGHEVVDISATSRDTRARLLMLPGFLAKKFYALAGQYYSPKRHSLYIAAVSAHASRKIKADGRIDFIFSQSSAPVGKLQTHLPIFVTSDQPFDLYLDGYVPNPAPRFSEEGKSLERSVAAKASAYLFPSEWAKDGFCRANPKHERLAKCIPWGGNLDVEPDGASVERDIAAKTAKTSYRFLFVGRDWERKRGDLVLRVVDRLRESGMDIGLDIVGAGQVDIGSRPDVTVSPFIDKTSPSGRAKYSQLLRQAHFLFVPSRAEAYGHVFCEAAAYGVPSISSQVGGIPTIVKDQLNGLCLPLCATDADFAAAIRTTLAAEGRYASMARAARRAYVEDLSWGAFATKTLALVTSVLAQRDGSAARIPASGVKLALAAR